MAGAAQRMRAPAATASHASASRPRALDSSDGTNAPKRIVRRLLIQNTGVAGAAMVLQLASSASAASNRLRPPESCFVKLEDFEWRGDIHEGVEACDVRVGRGTPLEPSTKRSVSVHFDLRYGPLVVASSRRGRLLGENRSVAEPINFVYGEVPPDVRKGPPKKQVVGVGMEVKYDASAKEFYVQSMPPRAPAARNGVQRGDTIVSVNGTPATELGLDGLASRLQGSAGENVNLTMRRGSQTYETTLTREEYTVVRKRQQPQGEGGGGGLFAGKSEQEPPAALYVPQILAGMRRGGLRTLRCPPELGYEGEGFGELPPDTSFLLDVELLES